MAKKKYSISPNVEKLIINTGNSIKKLNELYDYISSYDYQEEIDKVLKKYNTNKSEVAFSCDYVSQGTANKILKNDNGNFQQKENYLSNLSKYAEVFMNSSLRLTSNAMFELLKIGCPKIIIYDYVNSLKHIDEYDRAKLIKGIMHDFNI